MTPQNGKIGNARWQGYSSRHRINEVQVIVGANEFKQLEVCRHRIGCDNKHALLAWTNGHVRALLDDALFNHAPRLDHADSQHLRSCRCNGAHDSSHLPGTVGLWLTEMLLRH